MPEVFVLGGRVYSSAAQQTTFEQDAYLMALLRTHRIAETIDADGDVLAAVLRSGQIAEFLAAILVVDGTAWTRASADLNAKTFNALTEPEDKAKLFAAVESLLAGFFPRGGTSSGASPTSSTTLDGASPRKRPKRRPRPAATPASDTASGSMSSPPSVSSTASA